MYKLKLFLLPVALLLVFMALACAPPDDDDAPSSSGPTINNAIYDFATALLTVQGTDLSPTEAQIQTIRVGSRTNGVAFSAYTADAKPTGPDSSNLAKGKYRIKSDGTALWLRLTDRHKAVLEAKVGSDGLKKGLLTSSGAWAGLNTAKDLTVSNVPAAEQTEEVEDKQSKVSDDNQPSKQTEETEEAEQVEQAEEVEDKQSKTETEDQSPKQPKDEQAEQVEQAEQDEQAEQESPKAAITGATYNVTLGLLVITGTNLPAAVRGWDFSKLTIVSGDGSKRYTLPRPENRAVGFESRNRAIGSRASATGLQITLIGSVKTEAEKILVNDGDSDANGAYNLEAAAGFAGGSAEDTTNPITVSGYTASITSATYNANTGELYIRGIKLPRAVADWDFSKLTIVSGDGSKRYPLPRHETAGENTATGSRAGTTYLSITLSGSVKAEAEKILVKEGVRDANGAYNLEAAAGFAGGSAEDPSNPITVSGYVASITSAVYDYYGGELTIRGVRLPRAVTDWDFSKLTIVSGDGKKRYPLPRHANEGVNRATGSSASTTRLNITLRGSVKAEVDKILVKVGDSDNTGAYNLEAAAEFVSGSPEDPTTGINVIR